ncbi:hypothetical protein PBRA_003117 [Plasmodiophora brassicae]|uniref:DH domain-containing protein n=1 Tax=Plasmodiophora brassicae TaxID=37360 RepID=A0A0G4J754_PLABS|nr:hypothetical protein PBRA_003117 [Plasmodiophora brassicae]
MASPADSGAGGNTYRKGMAVPNGNTLGACDSINTYGRSKSWTGVDTLSSGTNDDKGNSIADHARASAHLATEQWGKSSSMRPSSEKSWGKHRAERANFEKREKLTQEVVDTERTYVNSLQTLITKYVAPVKVDPGKYGVKVHTVFENVEPIAAFHVIFLKELEKDRNLARTINKFGDYLKMYTTYISGYDKCVRLLGQMRKSRKFTKFLDETRTDPECKGLDLMSFLIMPIQRIPRYELLLRELISCDDPDPQSEMAQAYNRVRYIAKHVNETQRHVENMMKLLEIQDRISDSDLSFDLLQPHRRLLKEGKISQKTTSKLNKIKQRVLFLFSDIVLWTSSSNAYLGHVDISCISLKPDVKHPDTSFRMVVESGTAAVEETELIWRCETAAECQEWVKAIDDAMTKLCEVFISRLDDKEKEKFGQLNAGASADKAEMIRQAKLSIRRKKYARTGGAMHLFMKEKLNELHAHVAVDDDKSVTELDSQ